MLKEISQAELLARVREACGPSQRAWARTHGLSAGYLRHVLRGRRPASPRLLALLGLRRAIVPMSEQEGEAR